MLAKPRLPWAIVCSPVGEFARDSRRSFLIVIKNQLHFSDVVEFFPPMAKLARGLKRDFARQMAELVAQNDVKLKAAGFDPEQRLIALRAMNAEAEKDRAAQVIADEEARKATAKSVDSENEAYDYASSSLDLMVGFLGRDDKLSRILRNLRDEMVNEEARGRKEVQPGTDP